jgi:hypothetical protein
MPTHKETIKETTVVIENFTYKMFANILLSIITPYVEKLNEDQISVLETN